MRVLKTVLLFLLVMSFPAAVMAQVQTQTTATATTATDQTDYDRRHELAVKMQELRPAREQVDRAIDQYIKQLPPNQRESYRTALRSVLNYKAFEKISTDAYAETYTTAELEAMVEYFSKPEARSASDKIEKYAGIVYPEIIRMLDKALMQAKTGGLTP